MTLNPNLPPSSNFNLKIWNLTLPVPKSGSSDPLTITNTQLAAGYTNPNFFYTSKTDGQMVFHCPAVGTTTANSDYPRAELREVGTGTDWKMLSGSHILQATLQVVHNPTRKGIYIGQIHGDDANLEPQIAKLLWTIDNKITIQIKNDSSPSSSEITYPLGQYTLGETISYSISMIPTTTAGQSTLTVSVSHYDVSAKKIVTTTNSNIFKNTYWNKQGYYFKAGAYVQENVAGTTDYGEVHFSALNVTHSDSVLPIPTPLPVPSPVTPPPVNPPTVTIDQATYDKLIAIQSAAKALLTQITQLQSLLV